MALINCPECGKEISDLSVSCPQCGYPIKSMGINKTLMQNAFNTFTQGNFEEAYRLYSEYLNIDPENIDVIFYRGLCAVNLSTVAVPRYEEFVKALSLSIEKCIEKSTDKELDSFTSKVMREFAEITKKVNALFRGYVVSMDEATNFYGITGAIVKSDTMRDVEQSVKNQLIMLFINYCGAKQKFDDVVDKLTLCSNEFASNYILAVDSGYELIDMYTENRSTSPDVIVGDLGKLKKLNITINMGDSFSIEREFLKKISSIPVFGADEQWVKLEFWAKKHNLNKPEYKVPSDLQSGGCYIATCVYGSYDCPQVWTLRRYRDLSLSKTLFGRTFIKAYYTISPTLVKWFGHTKWFKKIWQSILDHLIDELRRNGVESTPYEDIKW